MIASLLAALALQTAFTQRELPSPGGGPPRLLWQSYDERLKVPKLSPQKFGDPPVSWEFDWLTAGFARVRTTDTMLKTRFRVYSQQRKDEGDLAPQVAQTLLRLFDYNLLGLQLDHNPGINEGLVDVYLSWGGRAGGEQRFDEDPQNRVPIKVNTIYIYDLGSFSDPVERVREVAHEYGHATLPAVGGFTEPEDWANGHLGERAYLTYLRDGLAQGFFTPDDTMGATKAQLDAYHKTQVQPLVERTALNGPNAAAMAGRGQAAMDAYLSLALYCQAVLPSRVFSRSLKLTGSVEAKDYPKAVLLAAEEPESFRLTIPPFLKGLPIWIPLGKGAVSGAQTLKRNGAWVQVKPGAGPVTIVTKKTLE